MENNVNSQQPPLNYTTKLAYGIGDLGGSITGNILLFFLSPFLTDVVGLAPSLAGLSQLVGKFWDAINDPIVGVLSDRTQSKLGRRYPWMIYGAIPFGIFFFLQWIIPHFSDNNNINQWGLFGYYTLISILFNSFYTVVNLPYTALTPELTDDYNERTSLNSFRFFFSIAGSILSVIIFGIIGNIWGNNPQLHYIIVGIICAVLSVIPIYICVWGTSDRTLSSPIQNAQINKENHTAFWQQLKTLLTNKPFLFVLGIYLFSWLSMQLTATILPYFVMSYMRLSNQNVVPVVLAVQGTAMIMLFVWSKVSERFGKKEAYFMGMSLWIIAQAGLFFLQPGQVILMFTFAVLAGFGVSVAYLIPWSMLPDVIDFDELNTGERNEGIYYSFMVFLQKVCLGVAVSLVLQCLDWTGYIKPTNPQIIPIQPETVLWIIRIAIGPLPTISLILGLILAYFYPITRVFHQEILLRLREKKSEN